MSVIKVKDLESVKDIFKIVDEPEYSKNKLLQIQTKYKIDVVNFYNQYISNENIHNIDPEILNDLIFNLNIYIKSGGSLEELKS